MNDVIQSSMAIVTANTETTASPDFSIVALQCWQECGLPRATPRQKTTVTLTDSVKSLAARHYFLETMVTKEALSNMVEDTASVVGASHAFCEWNALS